MCPPKFEIFSNFPPFPNLSQKSPFFAQWGCPARTCILKYHLFIYLFIFLFIYFHYGRQPLKNLKWYGLPQQTISLHFKFFKGCLPQILLGPFLKTLIHLIFRFSFRILGHSCDSVWVIYKDKKNGFAKLISFPLFHLPYFL